MASEWRINAPNRFNELDEFVEKEGYFLGTYRDDEQNRHLVLTKNNPDGTSQDAVFIFPVVNTGMEKVFIAPREKNEVVVYPVEDGKLYLSVEDAMHFFEEAKIKLD
ncbi:MAG: hypothetical protein ACD_5C00340G0003 [uncultured bacterium]|nr:MAG: hypothetical protein ACD_5C00340G0003 [uncultured bacterium]